MIYTECTICGCMPKPDEWSGQVQGVCFDCGQYLVLSNYVFCYDWNYILVYLKEFAEDMRGRPADDKQKPIGGLMMKQFIVFNLEPPLSPDPAGAQLKIETSWIWGQVLKARMHLT